MTGFEKLKAITEALRDFPDLRVAAADDVERMFGWRPRVVAGGIEVSTAQFAQLHAIATPEHERDAFTTTLYGVPIYVQEET